MNKSLITGLIVGGVAVTAAGAFAGYQAMDNRNSAEVLDVEATSLFDLPLPAKETSP